MKLVKGNSRFAPSPCSAGLIAEYAYFMFEYLLYVYVKIFPVFVLLPLLGFYCGFGYEEEKFAFLSFLATLAEVEC